VISVVMTATLIPLNAGSDLMTPWCNVAATAALTIAVTTRATAPRIEQRYRSVGAEIGNDVTTVIVGLALRGGQVGLAIAPATLS
jgi:hypothetical protein